MKAMKKNTTLILVIFFTLFIAGCSSLLPHSAYFQGVKGRLEQGADINASVNENQDSLLHISTQNHVEKEVLYLLKQGANPNQKNALGATPLDYTLSNNEPEADKSQASIITLLSKYGVDINRKNTNDKTALITAIEQNKAMSTKALLEAGANANLTHNKTTPLMLAVQTGNIRIVEYLLATLEKTNTQDEKGQTALHYTALESSKGTDQSLSKIANLLIANGAKLPINYQKSILSTAIKNQRPLVAKTLINSVQTNNAPNRDLFSPLMNAVYKGNTNSVRNILDSFSSKDSDEDAGSKINHLDKNNWGAIHLAAHKENQENESTLLKITTHLIRAGANINQQGPNKNTPLHIAIDNQRASIAKKLLDENANIEIQNNEGETALIKAIQIQNLDIIKRTASPNTINEKDKYGWAPIHFAVTLSNAQQENQFEIIKYLLSSGANIDLQTNKGSTALLLAIEQEKPKLVKLLLSHNANIKTRNSKHQTALMLAAKHGELESLESLITTPQNLNLQDSNGWTAIHHSSNSQLLRNDFVSAKITQILINSGADTNIQTNSKASALHFSVQQNHLKTTEILSKAGAKTFLKDENGITPLILAVQNGNHPIVQRLTQKAQDFDVKQNDGWAALHFTALQDNNVDDLTQSKIASAILSAGADVDLQIPTGETPLSIAIGNNKPLVALTLLKAGAKADKKDNNGWTPLMLAVYLGQVNIVKEIMNSPGNINAKNSDGMTALHITANNNSFGGDEIQTTIAHLLISNGADVNARAIDGSTPLHFAAASSKANLVGALLDANASPRMKNLQGWNARDEAIKNKNTHISNLLR